MRKIELKNWLVKHFNILVKYNNLYRKMYDNY